MAAGSPYSGTPVNTDDLVAFVPGVSFANMDEVYQAETIVIAAASRDLLLAIAHNLTAHRRYGSAFRKNEEPSSAD